ncbi:glycosyltransferase family protein [Dyadobacter aurulentus]|uniref:glycosyltransferase family 39 protein n=1 Tax=Dyadobacter sp. UC 10 TaxID=2605428 RepID=UPI0011F0EAFB|nr:glycosyltransferase family 39 protein [Dyadobacter sp. UC 10]KAA0990877.1 glycosyltransferase family 39 protein [Dyadobacter sp. UC 10]
MAFCLLLLSVALFFVLFLLTRPAESIYTNIRTSFIYALLANAGVIFIYNEVFSALDAVNASTAKMFWSAEVLVLIGFTVYVHIAGRIRNTYLARLVDVSQLKGVQPAYKWIILCALLFYVLPLFFLAVYAPPNNYDSHLYHLTRILLWINNGNLDHFPTMYLQQLYLNVFAEYLVLDTFLLSGSDQFSGLVQFGAFLGSLSGIGLLAKHFGMKQGGQLLATVFLLTLPIGIFESTSTQVDYCACFFFICYVYFGYQLLNRRSALTLAAFLLSLAFGGLSKYTIFLFALPFTVYFAVKILVQYRLLYAGRVLLLAIMCLMIVFGPLFYRNYTLFGHVMRPLRTTVFASEVLNTQKHSVTYTLSGIIKNAGLNLGLPDTRFNRFVDTGIRDFHKSMGVDINDQELSVDDFVVKYSVHEDMVPNTLHFWIILIMSIMLLFVPGRWDVKWLWICAVLGFVAFCTLMKFQLWSTRTQMPFFAMGALLVAFVFTNFRWKQTLLAIPLMLASLPFVYGNPNKELVSINFLTRKAIGHIPVAICETGGEQAALYEKYLGAYYQFPGADHCHPLKSWPGYSERRKVFGLLEKVGYYDLDRSSNIIGMERGKAYFLSHPNNYINFKPLLDQIEGDNRNVGIFLKRNNGFYHFWGAIASKVEKPGKMAYIRYNQELMVLKNAQKDFCYDYILSDDPSLLAEFVPENNIDTIYTSPLFQLVKLKKTSCDRSLF